MISVIAIALALTATGEKWQMPVADAYLHRADQDKARQRNPGDYPCTIRKREGGTDIVQSVPTDQCYKMLPPERMRGIWVDEFEGSRFYPNLKRKPTDTSGPEIWLDVERVNLPHGYEHGRRNGRTVLIDFIGRRTRYQAPVGHLGMSDYEIIVNRVLSARELPAD